MIGRVLALELLKLRRGRLWLALLALSAMMPLLLTMLLPVTIAWGKAGAAVLAGSLPVIYTLTHMTNGFVVWPLVLAVAAGETFSQEAATRTLRTLVVSQVGRRAVLIAKVLVPLGLGLASWLVVASLFCVDLAILQATIGEELAQAGVEVKLAPLRSIWILAVYTGPLAMGMLALVLFFTIVSVLSRSWAGVLLHGSAILFGLWWAIPQVLEATGTTLTFTRHLFTHHWSTLFGTEVVKALALGRLEPLSGLWSVAGGLAANIAILALVADLVWRRKEFTDG